MSCAACSARVEKAVSAVPGVTSCSVSLLTNSMGAEGSATPDAVISAEQAAGYAVALSNDAVREYGLAHPGFERMGTTLVSAVVRDDLALVSNVGDSRAYHITREGIRQVSRDHSVVEDMVEKGDLTRDEARHHPRRNLITRALGTEPGVAADAFPLKWQQGDFLLLCSDGLINTVSDQELLFEVIHSEPLDTCLDRLLALSRQRGAPDNVTAVLLMNI